MKALVKVRDLEKKYGKTEAIRGISFDIYKQEILCFLGPNGAAKTTMINILCGALNLTNGEILYNDVSIYHDLKKFKQQLGVVPQDLALYEDLTPEQNVAFFASLYGLKNTALKKGVEFALASVGLSSKKNEKVCSFSGGMKRRLNIACAIAHRPKLLIMDEPTVGIDPQSRNHILDSIKKMRDEGMTILYTTHYMEEVEEISTRIIIMDQGKIIATGTNEELKHAFGSKKIVICLKDANEFLLDDIYQIEGIYHATFEKDRIEITVRQEVENLDKLISFVINQTQTITNISIETDNLESVFLDLTGRHLHD